MQYDKTFKEEAVRLSDEIGSKKAADQLGIPDHTLSYWRRTKSHYGQQAFPGSGKARIPKEVAEQRIRELEKEITELRRANEILQEALGFFAVRRKK